MGFTVTKESEKVRQGNSDQHPKNRVWGNFETPNETRLGNRRHPLKTQQEKPTYTYKIASGRPFWPSRDPIAERGGMNLYGFIDNNAPNGWDYLGLHCDDCDQELKDCKQLALDNKTDELAEERERHEKANKNIAGILQETIDTVNDYYEDKGPWGHLAAVAAILAAESIAATQYSGEKIYHTATQQGIEIAYTLAVDDCLDEYGKCTAEFDIADCPCDPKTGKPILP